MNNNSKRVAICGVLTALAMIFSYIEALIPIPIGIPGVKLGIANIAIIAVIYIVGDSQAIIVNFLRIMLTGILFGNFYSFLFSLAGGMLSVVIMVLVKKTKKLSMVGVSIIGGVAHNIGQIVAAVFLMDNAAIAYYLPVLIIAGVVTGIVIGYVGQLVTRSISANFIID
ncbi:Gx transporter family protein [[Clostridium] fimetarium]|uniref:Heptaprenyl diphosphate synthase n=1 Tax=[Clostridium] fimetarium TaxID=99656 RepID=A0A1I0QMC1_9FIRM|nr:Gx transporter family protein [[Clostridium] fimetarium]SEW28482.1 heptaprenyl diphosphate synthase [[Clostridium] fimetarium]